MTISQDNLITATFRSLLAEAGPRQAEVLRACAVPRWFDLAVLAVLRDRADGNERVLELLRGYSFVRPLGAGRFAYSAEVRAALLEEWRAERPAELRALNQRLAAHFANRGAPAADQQPPEATITMRPSGDRALWQREALYHQLMLDPRAGMDQLRAAFDQAEAESRLADYEALLQTAQEAPIDARDQLWLRYMRARLDRLTLRLPAASEQLEAILAAPDIDPALAAGARQVLGEVRAETGQWAEATALYRRSLAYFEQTGERRKAAELMLLLGQAYEGLGDDTGGWHVPAYSHNPFGRALGQLWSWFQTLPFIPIIFVLRLAAVAMPQARYIGPYQNWPLIWLYRTANGWYQRSLAAFHQLGEEIGAARTELQLAEIERLFGYPARALERLERIRAAAAARAYPRAWIDSRRAAALLDQGQVDAALAILDPALAIFRELGDPRGEAAVLALQGRAAAQAGRVEAALASYRSSLARFRALSYAEAREQALYNLRTWRRQVGPGETSQQIGAILAAEPEKRYVARFPSSKIALLQILSLAALPLMLLLTAIASPKLVLERLAGSQPVVAQIYYDPLLGLGSLLILLVLYGIAYTLVALVVIFFVPLNNLEREQPNYVITSPDEIARYDSQGALAQRLRWDTIQGWLRYDQLLWRRPLPLFSGTMLTAAGERGLWIEAITGWYTSLQEDIGERLSAAGNTTRSEARGMRILRSASGGLLVAGVALLLLFIGGQNKWAEWLYALQPNVYAALAVLAFSGALILIPIAYWMAARPLAWIREYELRSSWPFVVGAVGLAAVLLFVVGGGEALPVPALNVGLLLWGAYLLSEALTTLLPARLRAIRLPLIAAGLLLAGALAAPLTTALYYKQLGRTELHNQNYTAAAQAYAQSLAFLPASQHRAAADSWNNKGISLYQAQRYAEAAKAYEQAAEELKQAPTSTERDRYIAALLFNQSWANRQANDPRWVEDLQSACRLSAEFCQRR